MRLTLWFMGRPSAGKSTLAKKVERLVAERRIQVENLDGDDIRKHLHPDLGFSREERRTNNRRTAYICKLLNENDVCAVTGMITPFRDAQQQARDIVEPDGTFVLVHAKCSVETAAERDPKNLYEKARRGEIEKFTGVNHPFQQPRDPDIVVDTERLTVDESVSHVLTRLEEMGLLDGDEEQGYGRTVGDEELRAIERRLVDRGYVGEDELND